MMATKRNLAVAAASATVFGLLLPMDPALAAVAPCDTTTYSLTGDCVLSATWPVPDGTTLDGNGHTITVDPGLAGPVIQSASGTSGGAPALMNVAHLTIDATGSSGPHVVGILYDGAKGTVSDVRISGVSGGTPGDNGFGIEADNSVGAAFQLTDQVKIGNGTSISGYQRAAVYAHGDLKLNVFRAHILAPASSSGQAVAGVLMTEGAHGTVKENDIRLSDTEPASHTAYGSGVQIVKDDNPGTGRRVEVKRNVFTGTTADFGVTVENPSTDTTGKKITAAIDCNLFRRDGASGTDPFGVGVGLWNPGKVNVLLSNSTFRGWKQATGTIPIAGGPIGAGPVNSVRTSTSTCPPPPPRHVRAARTGVHRITVNWRAALAPAWAPVTGYTVKAKAAGHRAVVKKVGAGRTSAVLKRLRANRTYVVTVTAVSNGGRATAAAVRVRL